LKLHQKEGNCAKNEGRQIPDSEAESSDKEPKRIKCDLCEKTFMNKRAAAIHKGIVHRKRTYSQALEDEPTAEFVEDIEGETEPEETEPSLGSKMPHICVCGKWYSYLKSFQTHKKGKPWYNDGSHHTNRRLVRSLFTVHQMRKLVSRPKSP